MNGLFDALSYIISSFKPITTSTYYIDPGKRVVLPNGILLRLISMKSFVYGSI